MILRSRNPFSLRDLAFSHGWIALPPWSWQPDPPALRRVERLPSGVIVSLQITSADPDAPTDEFHMSDSVGAGIEVPGSGSGPATETLPQSEQRTLRGPLDTLPPAAEAGFVRTPATPSPLGAGPRPALARSPGGPDPHCHSPERLSAADHAALDHRVR